MCPRPQTGRPNYPCEPPLFGNGHCRGHRTLCVTLCATARFAPGISACAAASMGRKATADKATGSLQTAAMGRVYACTIWSELRLNETLKGLKQAGTPLFPAPAASSPRDFLQFGAQVLRNRR